MNPLTPPWPRDLCEGVTDVGMGKIAVGVAPPLIHCCWIDGLTTCCLHVICGPMDRAVGDNVLHGQAVPFAFTDLRTLA